MSPKDPKAGLIVLAPIYLAHLVLDKLIKVYWFFKRKFYSKQTKELMILAGLKDKK